MTVALPRFNIERILKIRRKLAEDIMFQHHGYVHEGEAFDELVNEIHDAVPTAQHDALRSSLLSLVGVGITDPIIHEMSWRIAGNVHNLKAGKIVPPWSSQPCEEWVPVQVIWVHRCKVGYKIKDPPKDMKNPMVVKHAARVRMRILAGLPAGRTITKFMTHGSIRFARAEFGFSEFSGLGQDIHSSERVSYPMQDLTELTRMRFFIHLKPELSIGDPAYDEVRSASTLLNWNRAVMKKRSRRDKTFKCQLNYNPTKHPCFLCHLGVDKCQAACHPRTYTQGHCENCKNDKAFHDPDRPGGACVDCLNSHIEIRGK